jgi:hypothetical protein
MGENNVHSGVPDGRPRPISSIFEYGRPLAAGYLNAMIEKHVFGIDCIGVMSQYPVYAGVWGEHKTCYPKNYTMEFRAIASLRYVKPISLEVWDKYHIAIIDGVTRFNSVKENPASVNVDVCQSSRGGP